MNIIELFAGIGGISQGFISEGFDVVGMLDIDPAARETFIHNFPYIPYIVKDITLLSPNEFKIEIGNVTVDGIVGGPPCQGYSQIGLKNSDDPRNKLTKEYVKFVNFFKPKFIVIENVPHFKSHKTFSDIHSELKESYNISSQIVNAALFGVPQSRLRTIIIGIRKDLNIDVSIPFGMTNLTGDYYGYNSKKMIPLNTGFLEILSLGTSNNQISSELIANDEPSLLTTIEDAISDLSEQQVSSIALPYSFEPQTDYQRLMRMDVNQLTNHEVRIHANHLLEMMENLPEGGDMKDIFSDEKKYFSQAYSRMHRNGLSRTITNSFQNPGSGRYTHYQNNRSLSIREGARLQSIPDSFEFKGSRTSQARHIGNAVPVLLSKAIANHILELIGE